MKPLELSDGRHQENESPTSPLKPMSHDNNPSDLTVPVHTRFKLQKQDSGVEFHPFVEDSQRSYTYPSSSTANYHSPEAFPVLPELKLVNNFPFSCLHYLSEEIILEVLSVSGFFGRDKDGVELRVEMGS